MRILDVYLHGRLAGKLLQGEGGRLSFTYEESYINAKDALLPLSVSLPLIRDAFQDATARPFFSGLLPDDKIRHDLARYLGVSEKNPFALIEAVGGECAGAVAFYPEGKKPPLIDSIEPEVLGDQKLQKILDLLKRRPLLAGEEGIRLSLAGAQDKIAVGFIANKDNLGGSKIVLMKGDAPTSHILKPLIEKVKDSAHNEFFCLKLAGKLGISVVNADIKFAGETSYLLIERYDRVWDSEGRLQRLHQEDFCQALSIPPEQKYEREGGPGIAACLALLERSSVQPAVDRQRFIKILIFNYLIGNADSHGKNFSLLHSGGKPRLAPAYDLMSTAVYPDVQKKLAMKIGGEYDPEKIFQRHWHRLVADTAVARKAMDKELNNMAGAIRDQAESLLEELKEKNVVSSIFDDIKQVIERRIRQVLEEF